MRSTGAMKGAEARGGGGGGGGREGRGSDVAYREELARLTQITRTHTHTHAHTHTRTHTQVGIGIVTCIRALTTEMPF